MTIMDKGSIVYGSFFVLRYIKQDSPQYAFVVSKKIARLAVKRNYLRRKGYNIMRKFNIKSHAGLFFYKKEALKATDIEINKDIEILLKKIK